MIREPYSVVPYNTTIDMSIDNNFSLIFNGDELEGYNYTIYENNQANKPIVVSERVDNPNIYNGDTLDIKVTKKTRFNREKSFMVSYFLGK